jgi:glycosyltransferase involved in cell wall biosynthesis
MFDKIRILVGYDDSLQSRKALTEATAIAKHFSGFIKVVNVYEKGKEKEAETTIIEAKQNLEKEDVAHDVSLVLGSNPAKALGVIAKQENFELIVIDDGSTDGTDKYLKDIYKGEIKKEKIKFIELPENRGPAFARNEGLRKAKYNWIGYLDADNQMHSNFLATFAHGIERNQTCEIFYAQIRHMQSQAIIGHEFDFDELVQSNFIDLGVFVHSRRIYNELGGFDVKLYRLIDWYLIIKYTEKYPPKFIEKVLLDYDDNPRSPRITNTVPLDDAYKKVILNYFKRVPANNFIEKYTVGIQHLKHAVAERDDHIASLKGVVTDKEAQISQLEEVVREKDASLHHIYNSHGWKALLIYYKVRDKIFPINTKRRLFTKVIFNVLRKPKGFLVNLNKNNIRKF